jgi:predicted GNAT family N-acyltransferase
MTTDSQSIAIREARWPEDEEALAQLRTEVFVVGQGVPREIEWDGLDAQARHVIAERDGAVVGCGRLLPDGRVGRLAVLEAVRGQGLGSRLLASLQRLARRAGLTDLYLHAQLASVPFYERNGFKGSGETFEEAGIPHRNMCMHLDYRDWNEAIPQVPYPQPFAQLVVAQARLARRELAVLSPRLERIIFEQEDLDVALRALMRGSRESRIRLLVRDARPLVEHSHRLLQLARRVPSNVELRRLAEHPEWDGETQVLRDRSGFLTHPGGAGSPGYYQPDDRGRTRNALSRFEELWRCSTVDPEFRSLSL